MSGLESGGASGVIFRKTSKGLEEIESRAHGMPRRLRSALIMVDGHSTLEMLNARLAGLMDAQEAFTTLLREGFIEAGEVVASGGDPSMAQPVPATHAQGYASSQGVAVAAAAGGHGPDSVSRAKPVSLACPLHKPVCIGADCMMSYGCQAKSASLRAGANLRPGLIRLALMRFRYSL